MKKPELEPQMKDHVPGMDRCAAGAPENINISDIYSI